MNKVKYQVAKSISRFYPSSYGTRSLMYHSVENNSHGSLFNISFDSFRDQIFRLVENEIKFVKWNNWENDKNEKQVCLSFDDGYLNNLKYVAPFLKELNIPFIVFVISSKVGADKSFLDKMSLRELSYCAEIGAHGKTHLPLSKLSKVEMHEEISSSKKDLEDILGRSVDFMSYPHGSVNHVVRETVEKCHFKSAGCSRWEKIASETNDFLVGRFPILDKDDSNDVYFKSIGKWDWMSRRKVDEAY